VPPPPMLWVEGQESGSQETAKKALENNFLKEQDMMTSMSQVLPPDQDSVAVGESPLTVTEGAAAEKRMIPVEDKSESGLGLQDRSRLSDQKALEKPSCPSIERDMNNFVQPQSSFLTKEAATTTAANSLAPSATANAPKANKMATPAPAITDDRSKKLKSPELDGTLLLPCVKTTAMAASAAPNRLANEVPSSDSALKTVLPPLTKAGPLTEQPSLPQPAVVSQQLGKLNVTPGLHLVVLPIAPLFSPSHFGLRLAEREGEVSDLVRTMSANPPSLVPGWKIGPNQTLAMLHKNQWFRGVAVAKTGDTFTVYRVDLGDVLNVPKASLRPLPSAYCRLPPGCLQCSLVGIDPVDGDKWCVDSVQVFWELVNGDGQLCYPIVVEVLGRVKGGRLAVRLQGQEDGVDIAELMIEAGFAKKSVDNCIFGLEAEVEFELLGGKSRGVNQGKVVPRQPNKEEILPPSAEMMMKQDTTVAAAILDKKIPDLNDNVKEPFSAEMMSKMGPDGGNKNNDKVKVLSDLKPGEKGSSGAKKSNKSEKQKKIDDSVANKKQGGVQSKSSVPYQKDTSKNSYEGGSAGEVKTNGAGGGDAKLSKKNIEVKTSNGKMAKDKENHVGGPQQGGGDKKLGVGAGLAEEKVSVGEPMFVEESIEKSETVEARKNIADDKTVKTERRERKDQFREVKRIPKGTFPSDCKQFSAEICHSVSPESFFLCTKEQQDRFVTIMLEIQEIKEGGGVIQEVGNACLAFYEEDGMYYRAEIVALEVEKNHVSVRLVDHGKEITLPGTKLRPIEAPHLDQPCCVVEAALAGVQPLAEVWSGEDKEMARIVLSDELPVQVEVVGKKDGKVLVNLKDLEENDLAHLLIEAGVAAPRTEVEFAAPAASSPLAAAQAPAVSSTQAPAAPISPAAPTIAPPVSLVAAPPLSYGKLESGPMMVFAAASPVDLYLSTGALFSQYSDIVHGVVEEAGEDGTVEKEVIIGSRVLAHDGDGWYRSLVRNIDGDNVEVFILDLAALITVDASTLKVASPQLFELPIMAVPACLSGWEGEEDPAKMAEEWGEKMKELVPEVFTEVDAEVVEQKSDTKCKVRVPAWEEVLVKKSVSKGKAASLLMKLKSTSK